MMLAQIDAREPALRSLKACMRMQKSFPEYTLGERVADGSLHVIGVTASLVAATGLIAFAFQHLPTPSFVTLTIYGLALVAVFGCSAAYHLVSRPGPKAILRRCDHAVIYLKIAATYTPFALVKMDGESGLVLLAVVWTISLIGAAAKLLWPGHFVRTFYVLGLALGWSGILVLNSLAAAVSPSVLLLLVAGGGLYTIGIVFLLSESLRYHNAIWHAFVLAASACHFAAVVDVMAVAPGA